MSAHKRQVRSNIAWVLNSLDISEKVSFAIFCLVKVLLVGLDVVGLIFVGFAVQLATGKSSSQVMGQLSHYVPIQVLEAVNMYAIFGAVGVVFFIAKGVFGDQINKVISKKFAEIESAKANRLFRLSSQADLRLLDSYSAADLQRALMNSVQVGYGYTLTHLSSAFGELVLIAAVSAYLAVLNLGLFAALVVFFASVILWMHYTTTRKHLVNAEIAELEWSLSARVLGDFVANFRQIVSSRRAEGLIKEFETHRKSYSLAHGQLFVASAKPRYVIEIALMLGLAALLAQRVLFPNFAASPEVLVVFVAGAFRIIASLLPLQGAIGVLKQVEAGAQQAVSLSKVLAKSSPRVETTQAKASNIIEFREVTFKHDGARKPALTNLNFQISKGELVVISGRSGAGKSTLVDLLLGLRQPTLGEIRVFGIAPSNHREPRHTNLGYVPQSPQYLNATLSQNVALTYEPLSKSQIEKVSSCLHLAGLDELLNEEGGGLNQFIGNEGRLLSGGQLQRLALARALYTDPELLILDEFTSALDDMTKADLYKFIAGKQGILTTIVITHDQEIPFSPDRSIQL